MIISELNTAVTDLPPTGVCQQTLEKEGTPAHLAFDWLKPKRMSSDGQPKGLCDWLKLW